MPKIRGVKPDFWTDDDIAGLSMPARLMFIGLWNFACDNGHLQDKPRQIKMRIFPGDDVDVDGLLDELAASGRIERGDGWITVPNLSEHQKIDVRYFTTCDKDGCVDPPRKVSQRESRRVHVVHPSSAQRVPDVGTPSARGDGDGDGESDGDGEENPSSEIADAIPDAPQTRPDVEAVCTHLADRIEQNGSKRPTITKTWRTAARLLIDKDGRTQQQVMACIDWCQSDEFWRTNILSMPTLREKYDRLRLAAERKRETRGQEATDGLFARSAQRLGVTAEDMKGIAG